MCNRTSCIRRKNQKKQPPVFIRKASCPRAWYCRASFFPGRQSRTQPKRSAPSLPLFLLSRGTFSYPLARRPRQALESAPASRFSRFVLFCLVLLFFVAQSAPFALKNPKLEKKKKLSVAQERLALLDQSPAPVPSPHPCDQVYLTPSMVERVMCAVLKQVRVRACFQGGFCRE